MWHITSPHRNRQMARKELDKRICKVCNSNSVENGEHFIFHCNKYNNTRLNFYEQMCFKLHSFLNKNDQDKFKILMEESNVNVFSRFICNIYKERQDVLFKENNQDKGSPQHASRPVWAGCVSSCVILYKM